MTTRNSRQAFLGEEFLNSLQSKKVVIIGLGGGGSFVAKELAHVGFKNFILIDYDVVEEHNLIRLVGATTKDVELKVLKIDIAERGIRELVENPNIIKFPQLWQECFTEAFQGADLIFSCVDDFYTRIQLETVTRNLGIPLIDIGVSVEAEDNGYQMFGQAVLSHPKGLSFRCYNFCSEEDIKRDDVGYGDVGIRPQVVWPNSILAGIAVGVGVDILSNWTKKSNFVNFYKHLNGNNFNVYDHLIFKTAERIGQHSCEFCKSIN